MIIRALSAAFLLLAAPSAFAQATLSTSWPNQREGDFIIKDFRFKSGESIAELKQHYTTLGAPKRSLPRFAEYSTFSSRSFWSTDSAKHCSESAAPESSSTYRR